MPSTKFEVGYPIRVMPVVSSSYFEARRTLGRNGMSCKNMDITDDVFIGIVVKFPPSVHFGLVPTTSSSLATEESDFEFPERDDGMVGKFETGYLA